MKNRPVFALLLLAILSHSSSLHAKKKVDFEPPRGFYIEPFQLTMTSPVDNATIKYTLNGTDPLVSASAQSGASPLTITVDPNNFTGRDRAPGFCVRAIAVVADTAASNLSTHTYIFVNEIGALSPHNQRPSSEWPPPGSSVNGQLFDYGMDPDVLNDPRYRDQIIPAMLDVPTMSMVMDLHDLFDPDDGIYVNAVEHGREWERQCSLELINPDGSDGFHINCGVRMRGGWSRNDSNPKHAFRYFFRSDYGESKLRHPLFEDEGEDEFDKMDLRCSQNYSWAYTGDSKNTYLRDVFSRDLQRDMGQPYTRSRYYHLFINGTYWGLFQTQERSEAAYAETYFGGDRDDYDVIKVDAGYGGRPYDIEATDGVLDSYYALWEECELGFENFEHYYRVQGLNADGSVNPNYPKLVDVDNIIDYMLNTMFVGDFDGPISDFRGNRDPNNFYAIYNRVNPQGFLHFRHDAEHSLGIQGDRGSDRTGPFPAGDRKEKFNPQWLHQKLTTNPQYVLHFADRVFTHFFHDGAMTVENNISRWLDRKAEIDLAIIAESARWGDAKRNNARTRDDDWLPAVQWVVDNHFPDRNDIVLDQFINKGWYANFQPPEFNTRDAIVDKGFQLTMSSPVGKIYYTTDGSKIYGDLAGSGLQTTTLVPWTAPKRAHVPTQDSGTDWRTNISFDDSDWDFINSSPGGIGYEKGSGYQDWISHDVSQYMHEDDTNTPNSSCYIRIPFTLTNENLQGIEVLRAQLRYDDGFVLYLNGVKAAENMAPNPPEWNSLATDNHEADAIENFDLSHHIDKLKVGDNLLAIQALNVSFSSSDFLMLAQLQASYQGEANGNIISASAQEYTSPISINKTTRIKARVLHRSQWSAMNDILLSVAEDMSGLRPTEIHYNPIPDEGETKIDGDLFEFFEIKNISTAPVNLTGARFSKGISYEFPAGSSIPPGEFIVLSSSSSYFKSRYGFDADGQYSGKLSNGGERVVLLSAVGDTIINVKYNDQPPWPPAADSTGQSLVAYATQPQGDHGVPDYWKLSAAIHGSPNADDPANPVDENRSLPSEYRLWQNYPNPFNPRTTIRFATPRDGHVTMSVYNALGQRVEMLIDEHTEAGAHQFSWDGAGYAGGVYFVRMHAADFHHTVKILYLK